MKKSKKNISGSPDSKEFLKELLRQKEVDFNNERKRDKSFIRIVWILGSIVIAIGFLAPLAQIYLTHLWTH